MDAAPVHSNILDQRPIWIETQPSHPEHARIPANPPHIQLPLGMELEMLKVWIGAVEVKCLLLVSISNLIKQFE